jgi:hypothetical protein
MDDRTMRDPSSGATDPDARGGAPRPGSFFRPWRAWLATRAAVGAAIALVLVATAGSGTVAAAPRLAPVHVVAPVPAVHKVDKNTVLLLGDSTALTLGLGLSILAPSYGVNLVDDGTLGCGVAEIPKVTVNGVVSTVPPACNPTSPSKDQWPARWTRWLAKYHPAIVAILAGRWETTTDDWQGQWTSVLQPAFAAYVKQQLQKAVTLASSRGAHVDLLTAPCYASGAQPDGTPWPENDSDRLDAYNNLVRAVAAANPRKATLVNLEGIFCPGGTFESTLDGVTVRAPDGVHFPFTSGDVNEPNTSTQVKIFGSWIGPKLWPLLLADRHGRASD